MAGGGVRALEALEREGAQVEGQFLVFLRVREGDPTHTWAPGNAALGSAEPEGAGKPGGGGAVGAEVHTRPKDSVDPVKVS